MKKRVSIVLCLILGLFLLSGCAAKEENVKYDQEIVDQTIEFVIECGEDTDEEAWATWESYSEYKQEFQLMQLGLPLEPDEFNAAVEAWRAGVDECGAYVSHGDYTYTAEADGLEVSMDVEFEERDAEVVFAFDKNLYLDTLTVNANFGTSEIMTKAGLNTLMGMGIVFFVLILMSFIIYLFKFIPKIQEKITGKKSQMDGEQDSGTAPAPAAPMIEEEQVTDDTELIAVISAAIAASEGTGSDGFVVRSIRRRPSNKWNS